MPFVLLIWIKWTIQTEAHSASLLVLIAAIIQRTTAVIAGMKINVVRGHDSGERTAIAAITSRGMPSTVIGFHIVGYMTALFSTDL